MELFCPECGVPVPTEKVNAQGMVAFCSACDNLFAYNQPGAEERYKRQKIDRPVGLEVYEDHEPVMMSYRCFQWLEAVFIAPYTLIWNGIALGAVVILLSSPWRPYVPLMSIPVGFGLWMLYELLSLSLNRTKILLSQTQMKVYHGPLFAQGSVSVPVQEIKQVYCQQLPHQQNKSHGFRLNPAKNRLYELHAVRADATDIVLLGTDDEEVAKFIGQRIRQHVGLAGILPFKDAHGKSIS